jgi:hypothetical protein
MATETKPRVIVDELPAAALAKAHTAVSLVEVLVDGDVEELEDVTDGTVTLDATAASRGRYDSVTLPGLEELIPTDPGDLLAPYGNELRISRGIELATEVQLVRLGIFRIDRATTTDDGDGPQIELSGLDRSGAIIDATFEDAGQIASGTQATDAIVALVDAVVVDQAYNFVEVDAPLPLLNYEEGDDRWALCQGIAIAIGGELYHGRDGELVLRPVATPVDADPVATIAEGDGGVLLTAERDWDRADVYNRVIVTGENSSLSNTSDLPRGVATDDNPNSPTYYYGKFGPKPYHWTSPYISADVQAADAAAGILARTTGAPDVVNFGSIVDPARSPSDIVEIVREVLGLSEAHVLDQVAIPLPPDGSMSSLTRAATTLPSDS